MPEPTGIHLALRLGREGTQLHQVEFLFDTAVGFVPDQAGAPQFLDRAARRRDHAAPQRIVRGVARIAAASSARERVAILFTEAPRGRRGLAIELPQR